MRFHHCGFMPMFDLVTRDLWLLRCARCVAWCEVGGLGARVVELTCSVYTLSCCRHRVLPPWTVILLTVHIQADRAHGDAVLCQSARNVTVLRALPLSDWLRVLQVSAKRI